MPVIAGSIFIGRSGDVTLTTPDGAITIEVEKIKAVKEADRIAEVSGESGAEQSLGGTVKDYVEFTTKDARAALYMPQGTPITSLSYAPKGAKKLNRSDHTAGAGSVTMTYGVQLNALAALAADAKGELESLTCKIQVEKNRAGVVGVLTIGAGTLAVSA